MRHITFVTALCSLSASLKIVSATKSLTLLLSRPNAATNQLLITATLTNIGTEHLTILRDPRTVLDTFPSDIFHISPAHSINQLAKVEFKGAYVCVPAALWH
jgi:hypothetical protein